MTAVIWLHFNKYSWCYVGHLTINLFLSYLVCVKFRCLPKCTSVVITERNCEKMLRQKALKYPTIAFNIIINFWLLYRSSLQWAITLLITQQIKTVDTNTTSWIFPQEFKPITNTGISHAGQPRTDTHKKNFKINNLTWRTVRSGRCQTAPFPHKKKWRRIRSGQCPRWQTNEMVIVSPPAVSVAGHPCPSPHLLVIRSADSSSRNTVQPPGCRWSFWSWLLYEVELCRSTLASFRSCVVSSLLLVRSLRAVGIFGVARFTFKVDHLEDYLIFGFDADSWS